jgi:hypothetical protein
MIRDNAAARVTKRRRRVRSAAARPELQHPFAVFPTHLKTPGNHILKAVLV